MDAREKSCKCACVTAGILSCPRRYPHRDMFAPPSFLPPWTISFPRSFVLLPVNGSVSVRCMRRRRGCILLRGRGNGVDFRTTHTHDGSGKLLSLFSRRLLSSWRHQVRVSRHHACVLASSNHPTNHKHSCVNQSLERCLSLNSTQSQAGASRGRRTLSLNISVLLERLSFNISSAGHDVGRSLKRTGMFSHKGGSTEQECVIPQGERDEQSSQQLEDPNNGEHSRMSEQLVVHVAFGTINHSTTTIIQSGEAPFQQARSLHPTLGS